MAPATAVIGGCTASGQKYAKAKVSDASPLVIFPPVLDPDKSGCLLKKRKYVQLERKPSQQSTAAVLVPKRKPDTVFAIRKMAGKCLTLIFTMPFSMVTVCSGTSCLNATKKAACMEIEPCMRPHLFDH